MARITLEEIATSTKIGTRSLRALEEEDFDQLPGGIFNKGFVRAYAKYLGIDEEQAVADYLTAAGEQPLPTRRPARSRNSPASASARVAPTGWPSPSWCCSIAGGFAGWRWYQNKKAGRRRSRASDERTRAARRCFIGKRAAGGYPRA